MGTSFQPGDIARAFASRRGWKISKLNILVEGEHEQRYFSLADRLYRQKENKALISTQISIFPTGIGDDGGAFGLQRDFHPLRAIMDVDLSADGKRACYAVALFDDDMPGRRGCNSLTGQHLTYRKWRDVFLLQRLLPRSTRSPEQMQKLVDEANQPWRGIDCEIEDLISIDLLSEFLKGNHKAAEREPQEVAGSVRCSLTSAGKAQYVRFVEDNALLADVRCLVDFLKSMRYHLGLEPDGDTMPPAV
ncbi:hypothetical protein [Pedosphaera parvula]|uniref:Uncharacterized protein n=1 Tax=Pedosphaera parvula (strain Ellin514) TaxID=320771 RepID=B9XC27_PEDPL|nr:hypothetical protein [Pedosphaera parvula]EEF62495.1 conserved hypothetical protein [Pedosphaera parvula Ellin514]